MVNVAIIVLELSLIFRISLTARLLVQPLTYGNPSPLLIMIDVTLPMELLLNL